VIIPTEVEVSMETDTEEVCMFIENFGRNSQ
jgi:hypothetical protein